MENDYEAGSEISAYSFSSTSLEKRENQRSKFSLNSLSSIKGKAKQLRRNRRAPRDELLIEEITFIMDNTGLKRRQIQSWYHSFVKKHPGGQLTKHDISKQVSRIYSDGIATSISDAIFEEFDLDTDEKLNFPEYVVGMSSIAEGPPDEQLKWVFRLADKNRSGSIQVKCEC